MSSEAPQHEVCTPGADEIAWARSGLAAFAEAGVDGPAAAGALVR